MKFRLPPNAFPPLALSRDDARWLRDEMNAVVAETMRAERVFVSPRDGRAAFPAAEWKEVRARDAFRVFKQRKRRAREKPAATAAEASAYSVDSVELGDNASSGRRVSTASGAWTSGSNEDPKSIVAAMKDPQVPLLVAAGTLDGTMDDTVFGALAGDDVAWRVRTAYVKDKFADARILAKIDGPSTEDPFRSLCVKWFTKEVPALVGSFIQRRDFLILEATGSGVESDGTRFGYYMLHSIKLPGVPELSDLNVIRCKVSLCFIARELSPRTSHLFARGFSDARGEMIEAVAVALTAESIIAATLVIECATVKKLTWLMQKKQRARQQRLQRTSSMAQPTECESCHRSVKKLSLSKTPHACQACGLLVCAKCTVQKRIIIDVSGDDVVDRSLSFCFGCVMEAKRLSSWDVATDALVPERLRLQSMHKPPPVVPRSQSIGVENPTRTSSVYTATQQTSTFSSSNPLDGGRRTSVRSKSVGGIMLY